MSQPFRIGIIGVAGIANAHAEHLRKLNDPGVVIAAAADIKPEALAKFAAAQGVTATYADHRVMLREAKLDAVAVCTPNFLHKQHTIDALEAGCHVIVEKPMAMNAAECEAMIAARDRSGRQLVVGFQQRFSDKARFLRSQIAAGVLGDIAYVRVQALRRRGIPSWGVFGRKDLQGGGGMIDIGVHMLEVAHDLMGRPAPESVSGAAYTYLGNKPPEALAPWGPWDHKTYTVEDLAVGFVRFANGATLCVETSFAAHVEKESWNIQFMGTKGGAVYDTPVVYTDQNGYMVDVRPHHIATEDMFTAKMRHFVACARDGAQNFSTAEDGLAVQRIIDGLYASAEAKREVRF